MAEHLVDAVGLARDLDGGRRPTLIDVRWRLGGPPGPDSFRQGHLPGAVYVDLETDLADPPGPRGRHPLPDPGRFGAAMRRAGVSADVPVVVYDDAEGTSAARCWWLLRHHGHPDVRVLDGGLAAWRDAGLPLVAGPAVGPAYGAGTFAPTPGRLPVLDADAAARVAATGLLLDARAAERYRGEVEPVDPVAGHIPGARSVPATSLVEAGRFLRPERLRTVLAELGASRDRPVGVYCGSGVTAAHTVLALALVGVQAALYPGSWSEWVGDPARPVARGPQP